MSMLESKDDMFKIRPCDFKLSKQDLENDRKKWKLGHTFYEWFGDEHFYYYLSFNGSSVKGRLI